MKTILIGAAVSALFGAAVLSAGAADAATAIGITHPSDQVDASTLTLGFEFTVDRDLKVTALGAYDEGGDGLFFDAPVGLWNTDGHLLAQTIVAKDAPGGLDHGFRFTDIDPITLAAGGHYVVGAFYAGDFATSFGTGLGGSAVVNPHIHIGEDRFANTGSFEFPGLSEDTAGAWIGPNFKIAGAPEPEAWALLIAGFGLAGAQLRARRVRPA